MYLIDFVPVWGFAFLDVVVLLSFSFFSISSKKKKKNSNLTIEFYLSSNRNLNPPAVIPYKKETV